MNAPRYACGEAIRLGDVVGIGYVLFGQIVFMIDNGESCDGFPRDEWSDRESGYVIQTAEGALLHCSDESEMALLDRAV